MCFNLACQLRIYRGILAGVRPLNIITNIIGALGAITYVGFFAYKVDKLPLIVIVVFVLSLMLLSFYDDIRRDRTISRIRNENDRQK